MLSHQNSTGGGGGNHLASSNHVHGAGESSDAKRRHKSASEEGKVRVSEMMSDDPDTRVCTVILTGQISVTGQRPVFDCGYTVRFKTV